MSEQFAADAIGFGFTDPFDLVQRRQSSGATLRDLGNLAVGEQHQSLRRPNSSRSGANAGLGRSQGWPELGALP